MPYPDIHQISKYIAGTGITLLELTGPQGAIRLGNEPGAGAKAFAPQADIMVASPGTGLFLHRHPLAQTPLISAGAHVQAGQIIGLLQVGVLLIPVPSPSAGHVVGHLVAHGELVDFGKKLICLHPLTTQATP